MVEYIDKCIKNESCHRIYDENLYQMLSHAFFLQAKCFCTKAQKRRRITCCRKPFDIRQEMNKN